MIYDIGLEISYDYKDPVKDARHVVRVRPRVEPGQRLVSVSLKLDPKPDETFAERDFFGNALDHMLIEPSHDAMSVTMKARVAIGRAPVDLEATPAAADLAVVADAARASNAAAPMHFLGDSRIVRTSPALTAYARDTIDPAAPSGEGVFALARRIQADFSYKPGATKVDTPLEVAFAKRQGVCQDFAHVMIAALRGIGLPAAYVSGYLRTIPPPGKKRLAGADAMHAWVSVWLGAKVGWRGFDPTNGILALNDHITVATGRDYSDVAPIDGVLITAGSHTTKHTVDVAPVDEAAAQPAAPKRPS